jgi:hypothetical protein
MTRRVLVTTLLVLVVAPSFAQTPSSPLDSRVKEFSSAVDARDAGRIASFYAEDAVMMGPGTPAITGPRCDPTKP